MKRLTTCPLNQAILQEAPRRQELLRTFSSVPRTCNATLSRMTLPRCSMNDMLRSTVRRVRPGCENALNAEMLNKWYSRT